MKFLKTVCCFFFYANLLIAQANTQLKINGIIKGMNIPVGKISFLPLSLSMSYVGYKLDSAEVSIINNQFYFNGTMPHSHGFETAIIRWGKNSFITKSFFLDAGEIEFTCIYDSTKALDVVISKSKTNIEYQKYFLPKFIPIQNILDSFLAKREKDRINFSGEKLDSAKKETVKIRDRYLINRNNFINKYIQQYPSSFIPLAYLSQAVERLGGDIDEIKKSFNKLSSQIQNSAAGLKIQEAFIIKDNISVSKRLDESIFLDTGKNTVKINFKNNKYTLVDFWFSKCKPCISQFAELKEIYSKYQLNQFEVIGINIDKEAAEWLSSINKYALNWQHLWDQESQVTEALKVHFFPTNFLIDSTGKVLFKDISLNDLNTFLEKNLNKK